MKKKDMGKMCSLWRKQEMRPIFYLCSREESEVHGYVSGSECRARSQCED